MTRTHHWHGHAKNTDAVTDAVTDANAVMDENAVTDMNADMATGTHNDTDIVLSHITVDCYCNSSVRQLTLFRACRYTTFPGLLVLTWLWGDLKQGLVTFPVPVIKPVNTMKILGVMLMAQGLRGNHLWDVTRATIVSCQGSCIRVLLGGECLMRVAGNAFKPCSQK